MSNKRARVIAFYLPQFHPIPENNEWWGEGFTEWTNVGKAKPLYKGHSQPKVPADLGYYDLRMPEIRELQAQMAHNAGIEGFMYWHYWFGNGRTVLERPFTEVLESGKPDYPFCLGWANHSWSTKTWVADQQYSKEKLLIEQQYPGEQDYINHFNYVLKAFKDKRYIKIDNKPVFYIYSPSDFADKKVFIDIWQKLARENELNGIYFIGQAHRNNECEKLLHHGFDGVCRAGIYDMTNKINGKIYNKIVGRLIDTFKFASLNKYRYSDIVKHANFPELDKQENIYPQVIPNFDHSPRSARKGLILHGSTPSLFQILLKNTLDLIKHKKDDHRIVFLRSWNEWAEGNYVEPDLEHGRGYLNVLREELFKK